MNIAIIHAIESVARTISSDVGASSKLLRRLVEPAHLRRYGHEELGALARNIVTIAAASPDLAVAIYEAAFGYEEPDRKTPLAMGESQLLSLTTNPQQDYQMAWFGLTEALSSLLDLDLKIGVLAASRAVTGFIGRRHPLDANELNQPSEFRFGEDVVSYRPDRSYSWYLPRHSSPQDGPAVLKKFDEYLARIAREEDFPGKVEKMIGVLKAEPGFAVLWTRFLAIAAQHPAALADVVFPLAIAPPVLAGLDSLELAGHFIAAAYPEFSIGQRDAIETTILSLAGPLGERAQKILPGTIPGDLIATADMRAFVETLVANGEARPNSPVVNYTFGGRPFDTDAYLRSVGAEVDSPANAALRERLRAVEDVPALPSGGKLDAAAAGVRLTAFEALQSLMGAADAGPFDPSMRLLAQGSLATAATTIIGASPLLFSDPDLAGRVGAVLRYCAQSENPAFDADLEQNFHESLGWDTPSARTSAATGLVWLVATVAGVPDPANLAAIHTLARDAVCHVRLSIIENLGLLAALDKDWVWSELRHVVMTEPTRGVVHAALNVLISLETVDSDRVIELAQAVIDRYADEEGTGIEQCRVAAATAVADLYLWHDFAKARPFLDNCLSETGFNPPLLAGWIHRYADVLMGGSPEGDSPLDAARTRGLDFFRRVLDAALAEVVTVTAGRDIYASGEWTAEDRDRASAAFDLTDGLASQFRRLFGGNIGSQVERTVTPERARLYHDAKPILERLADILIPKVAHSLIEALGALVPADPAGVFAIIARAIRTTTQTGYALEPLACSLVVGIVARCLAEHREVFVDADRLGDLVDCLDVFAQAGWPEAQALTFRLPEIWR